MTTRTIYPQFGVSQGGVLPRMWQLWRQAGFGQPYETLSEYRTRDQARDALRQRKIDDRTEVLRAVMDGDGVTVGCADDDW